MYTPVAFDMGTGPDVTEALRGAGFGHLVSHSSDTNESAGLVSTALPFVVDDEITLVRAHFAKANPHWQHIDGRQALLIVPIVDAYVSPRWYPSKAENGKVVPISNYELIHLHGIVEIHHDVDWKRKVVEDLTHENEERVDNAGQLEPWKVSDAPTSFIDNQLKAIVGIEVHVEQIEAKQKLSQNRTEQDRLGVIDGLGRSHDQGAIETSNRMLDQGRQLASNLSRRSYQRPANIKVQVT